MAVTILCTVGNIQDRLSAAGVTLRADDNPPSAYGDVMKRASVWVMKYLTKRYPPSKVDLSQSDHANLIASDIATFFLCIRRGNPAPAPVAALFKMAADELKEIRSGQADLFDVAAARPSAPVMSNVRVPLQPQPHARVTRARSTTTGGTPSDYAQHGDLSQLSEAYLNFPLGA